MPQASQFTNRLAHETSPYLRQHAHNPVDWFPWGDEARARARDLQRPIFLSIGYSACHWCHVMEHESFEDPEIGRLLNDQFVSIKVDREERPDLDQIYMAFVQRATGHGGWPMSVFLTPDLQPFFGGTYFPPDERYGGQMPSFRRVLESVGDWWQNRRDEVTTSAQAVTQELQDVLRLEPQPGDLDASLLRQVSGQLGRSFDPRDGGFGTQPKFPHPTELRLLLRVARRFSDERALEMVRLTLDRMAMGGMYDQLGGGFHRYSTDARWLVPHFEKMLYDNALLTLAYLEAFQATGEPFYREVVEQTLTYVRREMTSPDGPFFSTQDADSEGEEGKFFVWSAAEIDSVLSSDTASVFNYVYGVTPEGNWEEHNILHRSKTYEQMRPVAEDRGAGAAPSPERGAGEAVRAAQPSHLAGRDEKVLTAWNGLMIAAFAQAAQVLDEPTYATAAVRAADFILRTMRMPDGAVPHLERRLDAEAERLPGGLRLLPRCPGQRLRDNLRAALDRGGAGPGPGHGRAILGRGGGWILLHGPRSRAADRSHQGPARQRHAVGERRGGDGALAIGEADRPRRLAREGGAHPAAFPRHHGSVSDGGGSNADRV